MYAYHDPVDERLALRMSPGSVEDVHQDSFHHPVPSFRGVTKHASHAERQNEMNMCALVGRGQGVEA